MLVGAGEGRSPRDSSIHRNRFRERAIRDGWENGAVDACGPFAVTSFASIPLKSFRLDALYTSGCARLFRREPRLFPRPPQAAA